jgi:signal peptidase I
VTSDDSPLRTGDADPAPGGSAEPQAPAVRRGSFLRELPFLVVIAVVLAMLIKAFLFSAFYIPSGSMEQTLAVSDRVLANKLVYDLRDVRRGEVVVFDGKGSFTPETGIEPPASGPDRALRALARLVGLGAPGEKDYIKRVIGLPGDRVACCADGKVTVQVKGSQTPVVLEEPYLYQDNRLVFCSDGRGESACPPGAPGVLVPEGQLFVMGDHRGGSLDSREEGTIPESEVIGRAFVIIWPVSRWDNLPVPDTFGDRFQALPAYGAAGAPYALGLLGALPLLALRRGLRTRRRLRRDGAPAH